jgi:hypothetical protein
MPKAFELLARSMRQHAFLLTQKFSLYQPNQIQNLWVIHIASICNVIHNVFYNANHNVYPLVYLFGFFPIYENLAVYVVQIFDDVISSDVANLCDDLVCEFF